MWGAATLDVIANDIAGTADMRVYLHDDAAEWARFFPPEVNSANVLGFVMPDYAPMYHVIAIGPLGFSTFDSWLKSGTAVGNEFNFAVAAMTLIHEAFHWRLNSDDESTVNACALKFFPYLLAKDFNIPETVTQTTTEHAAVATQVRIPVVKIKITKRRVKVNDKWVVRITRKRVTVYVIKTTTTYEPRLVTATVPNPLFQTLVTDAGFFYSHQPPPYNAGTCIV